MGPQTASILPIHMLGLLPASRWLILYEKKPDDMGMIKASSIPHADVEALLINAGFYKKSAKGLMFFKACVWHLFAPPLPECIHICTYCKNAWYDIRGPLIHATLESNR